MLSDRCSGYIVFVVGYPNILFLIPKPPVACVIACCALACAAAVALAKREAKGPSKLGRHDAIQYIKQ